MAKDTEDILNEPIESEDFVSDDLPENEDDEAIDPEDVMDDEELDIDDDEIDPIGDIGLGDSNFSAALDSEMDASSDLPLEYDTNRMIAPEEQVRWTVIPQENGDIWSEHTNGYVLRARPLSTQKGSALKYAAQLFKDNKILEEGVIWIDQDKDPVEYLQNISDRILDRLGLSNLSKMDAKPENDLEIEPTEPEQEDIDIDIS